MDKELKEEIGKILKNPRVLPYQKTMLKIEVVKLELLKKLLDNKQPVKTKKSTANIEYKDG